MDELLRDFVSETTERLDALDGELDRLSEAASPAGAQRLLRLLHAIKGACGFLPVPRLEALAHAAESYLAAAPRDLSALAGARASLTRMRSLLVEVERAGAEPVGNDRDLLAAAASLSNRAARPLSASDRPTAPPTTMRVEIAAIARIAALAAELTASRDELFALARKHGDRALEPALQRLANLTAELEGGIAAARVQSLGAALRHLPRLATALARDLGKEVSLTMTGTDAALDRALVEPVRVSVDQLVRNAIHHGIEPPATRTAAGKPPAGMLALSAARQDGRLALTVKDDGAGLDLGALRQKAIAAALIDESAPFTPEEAARLAFLPGLTSAASATRVSGRGIGLDVVKSGMAAVGGSIALTSTPGRGTEITLDLPAPAEAAAERPAVAAPAARPAGPELVRQAEPVPAATKRRILLVDDSPFFRSMLTPVLQRAGYEVVACASPADALAAARASERGFDIVVSDIDMPGAAESLRTEAALEEAPIIALASDRTRSGAFARVVTKFDREGLVAALADLGKSAA